MRTEAVGPLLQRIVGTEPGKAASLAGEESVATAVVSSMSARGDLPTGRTLGREQCVEWEPEGERDDCLHLLVPLILEEAMQTPDVLRQVTREDHPNEAMLILCVMLGFANGRPRQLKAFSHPGDSDTSHDVVHLGKGQKLEEQIKQLLLLAADEEVDPGDVVALPYSSGTKGFPKGILLMHRSVVTSIAAKVTHIVTG
ncbi:hypothetical protein BRADI_1g34300v3 [Brachypodium distachyon]|uniref:AMP-dependent synthetase/ligase domain-containing protein n=1 Tax=Brachypodium distachyon TaxID=15368 RepID=I1GWQ5_BRADI|nr:hypothetical protein BRADI_1g34300v3 [Brachypodium distachyon]